MMKIGAGQDALMAYNALVRQYGECPSELILRGKTENGLENFVAWDMLPQLRPFIFGIMSRMEGEHLGEVWIGKIPQGTVSALRTFSLHDNCLLPLAVAPGVTLNARDTAAMVVPGDVWWINGKIEAVLSNNSAEDFVFLCVTVQPSGPATYIPQEFK